MTSIDVRPTTPETDPKASTHNYRLLWRWHFYAGVFVAPILFVMAVTGSIYLFKQPFEAWSQRDVREVAAVANPVPLADQVAAAQAVKPGVDIRAVIPPSGPGRSTRIIFQGADSGPFADGISVYVNPGDGKVLGVVDDAGTFMATVRKIHGELMAGVAGDRIVETAACWSLILIATGTYMWWTTRRRAAPKKRTRASLRRLHMWTGVGAGVAIVFLVLSGLPWSGFWGDYVNKAQAYFDSGYPEVTSTSTVSGDLSHHPDAKVPWAATNLPVPESEAHHGGGGGVLQPGAIALEAALAAARPAIRNCPPGECDLKMLLPAEPTGVYTVVTDHYRDPSAGQTLHVDQYSGKILTDYGWNEYGVLAKTVELGIAIHEGRRYGIVNLLVMLGACLALIGLIVTGVWMWWKRRPKGSVGAPRRPANGRTTWGVVALLAVLGILFPLAGLTMVVVLVIDRVVQKVTA
ncbi:PepSY domain-containing protein [Herbidospora sp. NBRC 101105]|uniref:PepSY-associated TM helix domain-containing protein n=1 Tax=Herbidospora sp. NBRC 101105 TaxID=3032195 RepID=UPI0024A5ACE9|nr:PepSY domain-containing protein [Herbidospora sp. NBRC 101105]GLX98679.1 peptidase [Herbidospora sp. NBRC 101105]